MDLNPQWFEQQIRIYRKQERPKYERLAQTLRQVLEAMARRLLPLAIVQARAKSVSSFAEKTLRKRPKYPDPAHQFTDLCGARLIVHTKTDVELACGFIRGHFLVDEANSLDASERLRASEFGYRSVHYVVQFKPGVFPSALVPVEIPADVFGLKAEIQVRTIAQHAWADIGHDRLYKGLLRVPERWEREAARIAALLENADEAFARLVDDVDAYRAHYEVYLDERQAHEELDLLQTLLSYDPANPQLALRIARLQIRLERWQEAVDFLQSFPGERTTALLVCLGAALCRLYQADRHGAGYEDGRRYLAEAVQSSPRNVEALAALADTWIGVDNATALGWYEKAYKADPTDARAVAGYVTLRLAADRSLAAVPPLTPSLEAAASRCRAHAADRVNLPWALYHLGEFELLLGRPYQALAAYCKAIGFSSGRFMFDAALATIDRLAFLESLVPAVAWVRRLLVLARQVKCPRAAPNPEFETLKSRPLPEFRTPVVIVAGGCDAAVQEEMERYRALLVAAFREFRGTIISGGTRQGVPGLVGDLTERYPGQFATIAYVPEDPLPPDATLDTRYSDLRRTARGPFSALEPLQAWTDLVARGIAPSEVKVLGINGGPISAFEYRLALALGAKVGVLRDSGREAGRLLGEAQWGALEGLVELCPDPMTLQTFVCAGSPSLLAPQARERIAEIIHNRYRENQRERFSQLDPAMRDWPDLPPDLKASNYAQADHIGEKLRAIGKRAVEVRDREIVLYQFTPEELELLAEMEHARFNVERLLAGWTLGPRNVEKKQSPYLVSWAALPEDVKEWDRQAVREIPELLKAVHMEIQPL